MKKKIVTQTFNILSAFTYVAIIMLKSMSEIDKTCRRFLSSHSVNIIFAYKIFFISTLGLSKKQHV